MTSTPSRFVCRELDLEQGLLLIGGPEFDFDSFPAVAEQFLQQIDATVVERELNADLHVWLIDFEGCRLMLKGEHYSSACGWSGCRPTISKRCSFWRVCLLSGSFSLR